MSANERRGLPPRADIRRVFDLAWPIGISMLSYTVMSVADTIFVGRLGTEPLAAIGLAAITTHLFLAFPNGLLRGVKINTARATGAGDDAAARAYAWQGLWLAGLAGVAVSAIAPLGGAVFAWMDAPRPVEELARIYFGIRVAGAPLVFLNVALSGWFEGRGDTRTPMVASVLANALNVALDPLLIFGWGPIPAMGIAGAAAATVGSIGVGLGLLIWRAAVLLRGSDRSPSRTRVADVWRVGGPVGLNWVVDVLSWVLFGAMLARAGEVELAAHVLVIRVVSMSFLPGHAIAEASSVLVGQSLGAGRPAGAREAFRASAWLAVALMSALGVVFILAPGPLIGLFGAEAAVRESAGRLLKIGAAFQIFDALAMVALSSLSGAGDTRFVMKLTMAGSWLLKLPVGWALALPLGLGAAGAWLGLTAEIIALAFAGVWRVRGDRWLEIEAEVGGAALADGDAAGAAHPGPAVASSSEDPVVSSDLAALLAWLVVEGAALPALPEGEAHDEAPVEIVGLAA